MTEVILRARLLYLVAFIFKDGDGSLLCKHFSHQEGGREGKENMPLLLQAQAQKLYITYMVG